MDTRNYIDVTDRDGWHKEFPLAEGLVLVGSGPGSGVLLDPARGGGVAGRHLQLVLPANSPQQYLAINLDEAEVRLNRDRAIGYHGNWPVADGDSICLGDFTLVFHLGMVRAGAGAGVSSSPAFPILYSAELSPAPAAATGVVAERTSACIGLSLALDDAVLHVGRRLEGVALLQNLGSRQGVQFRVDLEGLPEGTYSIGPAPILFPNGEGKIKLSLSHPHGPAPAAGPCRILVSARAPEAYPGEVASAAQVIQIEPFYSHSLRVR